MNNTRFKDGRLGIGRTPIFPLDVSGNTRIEGDLVLKGTIADGSGVPIYFGHAGVTSTDGSNNNYHIGINKAAATDANFPLDVEGNININNGSLFINGDVAEFSNWTDIGETEESGIYRNTKVAIGKTTANHILDVSGTVNIENGDILLNGTTLDPNPSVPALQAYTDTGPTWKDATIITTVSSASDAQTTNQTLTASIDNKADKASPEFSGNVGIGKAGNASYALDILGDVNISSGALKLNGSTPVYSNWTVSNSDIFRNSKVTIGSTTVQNYQLYVNGNTHVNGTLSATTLDGNLEWSKIQNQPTTIATSQTNAIVANTAKVSSQWITGSSSKIYYNSGNVGIGTDSPGIHALRVMGTTSSPMYGQILKVSSNASCWLELEANAGGSVEQWGINCSSGAGDLHFYKRTGTDSGDYRLTIKGNGNVGIGTTSPTRLLHLHNPETNGLTYLMMSNNATGTGTGDGFNIISEADGAVSLKQRENKDFKIFTNNSQRLTILGGGNVGIGTTSPYSNLHINKGTGSAVWNTNFKPADCHLYLGGYEWGAVGTTLKFGFGYMDRSDGNIPCYMGARVEGTSVDGEYAIVFGTRNSNVDTVVPEERMCITHDGLVGIGTTSPDEKLHINGGKLLITDGNGQPGGKILGGVDDGAHAIHFRVGEDGATDVLDFHEYGKIRFYTGGLLANQTERMCILSDGNVGIGTTDPLVPLTIRGPAPTSITSAADFHLQIGSATEHGNSSYRLIGLGYVNVTQNCPPTYIGFLTSSNSSATKGHLVFGTRNATDGTAPEERMRITDSGKVGIGETVPDAKLHIYDSACHNMTLWAPHSTKYFQTNFFYGGHHIDVYYFSSTKGMGTGGDGGTMNLQYYSDGHLNLCHGGGTCTVYNYSSGSDARIKHNEKNIEQALETIRKLKGQYYIKTPKLYDENHHFILNEKGEPIDIPDGDKYSYEYGFIAQDVEKIPELNFLVSETLDEKNKNDDWKSLKYNDIFVLNVAATQELDKENQELKTKVANLEAKLQSIEQRLAFAGF